MTEGTQAFGEGDSVDAMPARSSLPLMPGGTFSARKMTFVPSVTG